MAMGNGRSAPGRPIRWGALLGMVFALALLVVPMAWAQETDDDTGVDDTGVDDTGGDDTGGDDTGGDDTTGDGSVDLDALLREVEEGEPGEKDLPGAEALFETLGLVVVDLVPAADLGDGSELTGACGGYAWSYDEDGELIDAAYDAGDGGPPIDLLDGRQALTSSNPFKVDTGGIVEYFGFMPRIGDGPLDHEWYIRTGGISFDKGGDPNPKLKNLAHGLVDLRDDLPVKFNAKVRIEGRLDEKSGLGPCIGHGHVEFVASGITPTLIGGLAALGGGILGLLFNARPAKTTKGAFL